MACAVATLRAHAALAATGECAEPARTLVREVRKAVQGNSTSITVVAPGGRGPLLIRLQRTAVDVVAHIGGEAPLELRSPSPLDAQDTFLVEPTTAEPFQIVLKPAEVTGPGAAIAIRIERLTAPVAIDAAATRARRGVTRAYVSYQTQIRLEENAATATLAALGQGASASRTAESPAAANWQSVDAELVKASDALRGCEASLSSLVSEILTARAALAALKLENWETAMKLSRDADARAQALNLAATATRMQILQASALIDGAAEAKRSNEPARQDEATRTFADAVSLLQTARSSYQRNGRVADEAYVENYLGAAGHYSGSWDEARRHYQAADRLYAQRPPSFRHAVVKQNRARLANDSGNYSDAAQLYEQAAAMITGSPQPDMLATILENQGATLSILGRQDEAIAVYSAALNIRRTQADQPGLARATLGIGQALARSGDTESALPFIEQAWTIRTANRERDRRGWFSSGLARAEALRMHGKAALALQAMEQIQSVAVSPSERARFGVQRAKILADLADHTRALAEYDAVLALDLPPINPNVMFARIGRLRSLIELRKPEGAGEQIAVDRALADSMPGSLHGIEAQFLGAELQARLGNRQAALAAVEKAIAATRRIRSGSLSAESRARFMASRREQDELRICLFAGCATLPSLPRDALGALIASEHARTGALAELIAGAADRRRQDAGEAVRRGELLSGIDAKLARIDVLSDRSVANAREIAALRRAILESQAQLRGLDAPHADASPRPAQFDVERLLARLPADTTVLEYFLGRKTALVWAVSRKGITVHEIASGSSEVAALRTDIRALLHSRAGDPGMPQRLARLGRRLVEPYVDVQTTRRLVIVPDGELSFVPFAALPLPGMPQLVDRFETVLAPSLMRLGIDDARPVRLDTVAIIADPVFDADDPRAPASVPPRAAQERTASSLARLPATGEEVRSVQAFLKDSRATVLTGTSATRDNVLKALGQQVAIAHFASHAVIRASDPSLSFLALSAYDDAWRPVPARLYSSDIIGSGIRADLVVLSACRSAVGEVVAGEGPLGLSYSFLANGSGAVVAATWPVPDAFAAEFMRDFYNALARDPRSPAGALRAAQLQARKSRVWSDAYYWSAFSLTTLRL
jgi:CHAT domain-containing protein/tetratricopeptide (TPR) repeat protein